MGFIKPWQRSAALLAALSANAVAQQANPPQSDSTLVLGTVTVSAASVGPLPTRSVLTSVDVLGANMIQNQVVDHSWELLGRIPGVMLTDFNQGTTSGKFSFRAFNGEGEINAVKLLIDGIPSNSNDGNMPYLDMIFPLDIEYIETVRGTNDPRHGLHNIAGNANIVTRTSGSHTLGRVSYGSFNSLDAQVAKGIDDGSFSQQYFAGVRSSDGYRDHSKLDKYSLAGKWFYGPQDGAYRLGLVLRHHKAEAEEPGYLTRADSRTRPTLSYTFNASDQGERRLGQYSAHLDAELGGNTAVAAKAYLNDFNDQRWVKFSAGVSQQERVTDERHYGALAAVTYRPKVSWATEFALEGGIDAQFQENESRRYLTVNRVRQSQTRDQKFDFDIYGAYVQVVYRPIESLKLVPAYRVDTADGNFVNRLNGTRAAINDYGLIKQPKFSIVYTPAQGYSVYGNWGRTFQVGVGASAYKIPPRVTDLEPSLNTGWETGLKFSPAKWIEGRVALWQQTATGEERRRLNDPSNESDNIGKTRRRGVDFEVNLRPTESVQAWLAYARQDSEILVPDPAVPASLGKEIDHIPHQLYSAGVDYQFAPDWRVSLWVNGQSDYFLERTNSTGKFGGFTLVNVGLNYRLAKQVSLDFQIKNLTDRYFEYVWYDGTQSLHSPGDKRAFYVAANLSF